jgi:hypothetical protein
VDASDGFIEDVLDPPCDDDVVWWVAALLNVDEVDTPGAGAPAPPATLAPATPVCAMPAAESVAVFIDIVDSVVPTPTGAAAMAPMLGNDPAPQRHWQLQEPSA